MHVLSTTKHLGFDLFLFFWQYDIGLTRGNCFTWMFGIIVFIIFWIRHWVIYHFKIYQNYRKFFFFLVLAFSISILEKKERKRYAFFFGMVWNICLYVHLIIFLYLPLCFVFLFQCCHNRRPGFRQREFPRGLSPEKAWDDQDQSKCKNTKIRATMKCS